MIEKAKFWRWSKVRLDIWDVEEVMESRVIHLVPQLDIKMFGLGTTGVAERVFRRIVSGDISQLKRINVEECQLLSSASNDHDLAAEALTRVETLDVGVISTDLARALFQKISSSENVTLVNLSIHQTFKNCGSEIDEIVGLLATALVRLELVYVSRSSLSQTQFLRIFQSITNCQDLRLRSLNISVEDLSGVGAGELVSAVSRLGQVSFSETGLLSHQIVALLRCVADGKSNLRNVFLKEISLESVPPKLINQARARLQVLELDYCKSSKYIEPCRVT